MDISQKLHSHLKLRMWRDVEEQTEGKLANREAFEEIQHKIISRSYFMATTAFVWSTPLTDDNGDLYSFLLTAQKNGILVLWIVKVVSNFNPLDCKLDVTEGINIEVNNFLRPKIGPISSLDLITVDNNISILFIGGFNGRVKVNYLELYLIFDVKKWGVGEGKRRFLKFTIRKAPRAL